MILVVAVPAGGAGAAGPVSGLQSGSWWVAQPSSGVIPAPPTVPTKGLWVGQSAAGPTAVSAIRFVLTGASAPVVTLHVHEAQPAASVAVVACPATVASAHWKPATAGAWSDRPAGDCTHRAEAVTAAAGVLRVDLSGLPVPDGGAYDIVLQPATGASAFDATFDAPGGSDVAATPAPSPAPSPAAATAVPAAPPAAVPETAAPAVAPPPVGPAPAVPTAGDVLVAPLPAGPATTTPPAPAPTRQALSFLPPARAAAARPAGGGITQRERWLLAMIVLDIALFASWQGWLTPGRRPRPATLYDVPVTAAALPAREGRAPALR